MTTHLGFYNALSFPSPYRCQRTEVLERFCIIVAFFLSLPFPPAKYIYSQNISIFLEKSPLKNEKKYFFLFPHCISSSFDRRWPLDRPLVHQMGNNGLFARLGGRKGSGSLSALWMREGCICTCSEELTSLPLNITIQH